MPSTPPPPSRSGPPRLPIPLSVPHLEGGELEALREAIDTNWIAAVGPQVDSFEEAFAEAMQVGHALATTSGTAALHLALRVLGVGPGDDVLVSTLTFCASVNPVLYLGARPVFVDAERTSWNLDAERVAEALEARGREGRLPAAVIAVHVYGQLADLGPIVSACRRWGVPLVEDAAESLGARIRLPDGRTRFGGTVGDVGIFSFDGSKMITTSMGGMLVSDRPELVAHARKLARQAREPVPHYEHLEVGYNYRMSNLLAAFGQVQLGVLADRVAARRSVFERYRDALDGLPGLGFQPEFPDTVGARWLTCILLDPDEAGIDPEGLRLHLLERGIESRPVWKPMHLQPVYREMRLASVGGEVAEDLYRRGLCLPSSSSLTDEEIAAVVSGIRSAVRTP